MGAGLGDIAVPGLLACLALRFDSSKMRIIGGMNASAQAAASAFKDSYSTAKVPQPTICLPKVHQIMVDSSSLTVKPHICQIP